jgi:chemotaxis signal transduction protein
MLLASMGCMQAGIVLNVTQPGMPPLSETVDPIEYLTPYSQRYRVAVLNFRDQTGRAGLVTEAIADVLTTSLFETQRFNLYDRGDYKRSVYREEETSERVGRDDDKRRKDDRKASDDSEGSTKVTSRTREIEDTLEDQFRVLSQYVDGALIGYVTAYSIESSGKGYFDADFRIVTPDRRLVVYSGNTRVRFESGKKEDSIRINRNDVTVMAERIAGSFVDLAAVASKEIRVTDVQQDSAGAKITLNVGRIENNIKLGFAGFVVERDVRTKIDNYLAKFIIVNVFEEASVGVVVRHCNKMVACAEEELITPEAQIRSVNIGARVKLK